MQLWRDGHRATRRLTEGTGKLNVKMRKIINVSKRNAGQGLARRLRDGCNLFRLRAPVNWAGARPSSRCQNGLRRAGLVEKPPAIRFHPYNPMIYKAPPFCQSQIMPQTLPPSRLALASLSGLSTRQLTIKIQNPPARLQSHPTGSKHGK